MKKNTSDEAVLKTLRTIRQLMKMEVAFVSEFTNGKRVIHYLDSNTNDIPVYVGTSDPLENSYCQRVVDGRLPELIQDARLNSEAMKLVPTMLIPIGAHLSVPIRFSDGRIYGTFCCFSRYSDYSLDDRDVATMKVFADLTATYLEKDVKKHNDKKLLLSRLEQIVNNESFEIFFQPIVNVEVNQIVGYEALTRFMECFKTTGDQFTTSQYFKAASKVGFLETLEIALIKKSLKSLSQIPEDVYLSLNVSPDTILDPRFKTLFNGYPLKRIMLEITEHFSIQNYAVIKKILEPFRKIGLTLAIDDTGTGFACFSHILKLKADVIKIDFSLTHNIHLNPDSRALIAALVTFAKETNSKLIAEGVETIEEFNELKRLDVNFLQGYYLGRPDLLK